MTPDEALTVLLHYARWAAAYNDASLGRADTAVQMRREIGEAERVLRAALGEPKEALP